MILLTFTMTGPVCIPNCFKYRTEHNQKLVNQDFFKCYLNKLILEEDHYKFIQLCSPNFYSIKVKKNKFLGHWNTIN